MTKKKAGQKAVVSLKRIIFSIIVLLFAASTIAFTAARDKREVIADDVLIHQTIDFSSEIIELTDDVGQNYFVNYRMKREQFREKVKEMLQPLLESDLKQTRIEAQERWLELSNKIGKEGEIENVLKMRGYQDVVSEVNNGKATITVLAPELTYQEIYQITTVSADITGFSQDRIEVLTRR